MRDSDNIAERVEALRLALDELKTAQFTSQDSGMKFIQITPVETTLTLTPPSGFENLVLYHHEFTAEHDYPLLLAPHLELQAENVVMTVTEDSDNSFHRIISFEASGSYAGYADIFSFYHETHTSSKTRELISVMYYWFDSTVVATIPFTVTWNLRATDKGTATQTGEVIAL